MTLKQRERKSGYGNTTVYLLKILVLTNRTAVLPYTYILALCFFFALIPLYIKSIQTNKDILFNQFVWNRRPLFPFPFCSLPSRIPLKTSPKCSHAATSHTVTFNLWLPPSLPPLCTLDGWSEATKQHNSATRKHRPVVNDTYMSSIMQYVCQGKTCEVKLETAANSELITKT